MVRINLYPLAAARAARATPVLPLVGSTIVPPFFSLPDFSASSIIYKAILSLIDPAKLFFSTFTYISALPSFFNEFNFKRGVPPINSVGLFFIL